MSTKNLLFRQMSLPLWNVYYSLRNSLRIQDEQTFAKGSAFRMCQLELHVPFLFAHVCLTISLRLLRGVEVVNRDFCCVITRNRPWH